MRFSVSLYVVIGSAMLLLLLRCTYGLYYEEGTDSYLKMLISGDLTGSPERLVNYGIHTFVSIGLFKLYSAFPSINWYDCYTTLLLLVATIFFMSILLYLKNAGSLNRFQVIMLFILFSENLFLIQVTRISFLLSTFSIISILIVQQHDVIVLAKKQLIITLLILFLFISYCTRFEPPFLVTIIIFLLIVAGYFTSDKEKSLTDFFRQYKIFLLLFSIAIVALLMFKISFNETDSEFIEVRQYTYNLWDFKANPDKVILVDRSDSIAYATACNYFIADSAILNKSFFDKIGVVPMDKSLSNFINYFRNIGQLHELVWQKISNSEGVLFTYWILFSLLFVVGFFCKPKIWLLPLLVTSFFFLSIIVFMKGEFRVVSPLLFTSLLAFLVIHRHSRLFTGFLTNVVLLILTIGCVCVFLPRAIETKANSQKMVSFRNELAAQYRNKPVFVNLGVFEKFRFTLFDRNNALNFYSLDNGYLFLYENQKEKLRKLTGSSNFIDVMDFIHKEEIRVVSNADRMTMIVNYTNQLYGKHYRAEEISHGKRTDAANVYLLK